MASGQAMAESRSTAKPLKRRLTDDEEGSSKRTRTEEPLASISSTSPSKNQNVGKNLAAKRLNLLRQDIKIARERTNLAIPTIIKSNTSSEAGTKTVSSTNKQQKKPKGEDNNTMTPKKCSINDRLKSGRPRRSCSSEDGVIIEIDDSPAPFVAPDSNTITPKKCSINDRFKIARSRRLCSRKDEVIIEIDNSPASVVPSKKPNALAENRPGKIKNRKGSTNESFRNIPTSDGDECFSKQTPINQRLPKIKKHSSPCENIKSSKSLSPREQGKSKLLEGTSLLILSEASDSEASFQKTPINQRLNNIKKALSSCSSVETLTPNGAELSTNPQDTLVNKERSNRGLHMPLKRHLFKSPNETSSRGSSPKKIGLSFNNNDSPSKSYFDDEMAQKPSVQKKLSSPKAVSSMSRESKRGCENGEVSKNSLSDRLSRIRNQNSNHPNPRLNIKEQNSKEPSSIDNMNKVPLKEDVDILQHTKTASTTTSPDSFNIFATSGIPRSLMVQDWMESTHARSSFNDDTISDSLMVNVDDTLLNKTELLTDPQEDLSMEWDTIPESRPPTVHEPLESTVPAEVPKQKVICVVTDTNVFMHDLSKIKDLLNLKVPGNQQLKIYIPWMVLQELDYHKDSHKQPAKSIAMEAQKFINRHLVEPESRLIGQSVQEVCQQMEVGKSPDDKILACCLQVKDKYESIILLSNDVNLCNKALTSDIKAYTAKEILGKLKNCRFLKIKVRLQTLLSQIISQTCREAFGEACSKMDMLQDCPWSFEGCLKRFKRYWGTVFRPLLLKQSLKAIDDLICLTNRGDVTDTNELDKFVDKLKEFLFYLQDIDQFNSSVKKIRDEIDNIV